MTEPTMTPMLLSPLLPSSPGVVVTPDDPVPELDVGSVPVSLDVPVEEVSLVVSVDELEVSLVVSVVELDVDDESSVGSSVGVKVSVGSTDNVGV